MPNRILTYSKRQEERLIKQIEKFGGEVIRHYGDREKNAGDVLAVMFLGDKTIRIRFDHKSTQSKTKFILENTMLSKLTKECLNRQIEDGNTEPAISFAYYGARVIYVASTLKLGYPRIILSLDGKQGGRKHFYLERNIIERYLLVEDNISMLLTFRTYPCYLYTLENFIFRIKEGL